MRDTLECKRAELVLDDLEIMDDILYGTFFDETDAYAYREKIMDHLPYSRLIAISSVLDSILADSDLLITDQDAMFKLVIQSVLGTDRFKDMPQNFRTREWAEKVSRDMTLTTLFAAKVGTEGIKTFLKDFKKTNAFSSTYKNWVASADFYEKLLLGANPQGIIRAHRELLSGTATSFPTSSFEFDASYLVEANKKFKVFKLCGLLLIKVESTVFVLDNSALSQVYQCMRFWANYAIVSHNYRITGDDNREDLTLVNNKILHWLKTCEPTAYYKIPRHMKVVHNIMMNEFHNKVERVSLGSKERIAQMMLELNEHIVNPVSFYTVLTSAAISDRLKMDLSYIFHGLPAPDCDGSLLIRELHKKSHESNIVDQRAFDNFLRYSKAFDLCNILRKYRSKAIPYMCVEDGYNYEDKDWFKASLKGENTMPPVEEMGKAWIEGFFKHEEHMEYWYLEASDATHVASDVSLYSTVSSLMKIPKEIHNELLYTLKYGDKLDQRYKPKVVREKLKAGEKFCDWVAVLAAKSENTKYDGKVRETLSASDVAREATSDMDRCANKVTKLGSASTMRMPVTTLNKKFKDITEITRDYHNKRTVIMSLDVSGWSPNANRKYMFEHIRYVLSLTEGGNDIDYEKYWDQFKLLINKRGSYMSAPGDSGMYQGFTGSLDTVLHQHMLFFAVRMAKERKILKATEAAYGMCLIDDGVIAIDLDPTRTDEEIDATSAAFAKHVCKVYALLGFKVDKVKTLVSNTKFVYLNRFFADGSEVLMPTKVMCKMDRELNRKYSTIREQIQSVFGSGSSAVIKGGDPVLSYHMAVMRSLQLLAMTHPPVTALPSDALYVLCFAPRNVGGLNMPSIQEWIAGCITDHYLHFAYIMGYVGAILDKAKVKNNFVKYMDYLYSQPFDTRESLTLLNNIRDIRYKDVIVPEAMVSYRIREAVTRYAVAPHYKETLKLSVDPKYIKAIYKAIRCLQIDASVLEEVMKLSPLGAVQGIVTKCTKNELFNCLMKPREKTQLLRELRKADLDSITTVIEKFKSCAKVPSGMKFTVNEAYIYVKEKREMFYEVNGLTIVNHTVSDPSFYLVRGPDDEASTVKVNFKSIMPTVSDSRASIWNHNSLKEYSNMYDGRSINGIYPGTMIQGVMSSGFNATKDLNPIRKTVVNASCLSAYIMDKDNDGGAAFSLITSLWGCADRKIAPVVEKKMDSSVSTKRLGDSLSSVSNQIVCYPNCNNIVEVDTTALGRYLDESSIHVNFMSIVVCAKISGLLEYATTRTKPVDMCYNVTYNSEAVTDQIICMLIDGTDETFDAALMEISNIAPLISKDWFKTALDSTFERQDIPDGIAEGIELVDHELGFIPAGGLASILIASRSEIAQKSIYVNRSSHRAKRERDQELRSQRFSRKDRFRKLVDKHKLPEPNAAFCVAIEVAGLKGSKKIPDGVYLLDKRDMYKCYDEVFGNLPPEEILSTIPTIWKDPYIWKSRYVMEGLSTDMKRVICGMPVGSSLTLMDEENMMKSACVTLYSIYHGRLINDAQYRFTSAYDPNFFNRTQRFAALRDEKIAALTKDPERKLARKIAYHIRKAKANLRKPYRTYADVFSYVDGLVQIAIASALDKTFEPIRFVIPRDPDSSDLKKWGEANFRSRVMEICRIMGVTIVKRILELYVETFCDIAYFSFGDIRIHEASEYKKAIINEIKEVCSSDKSAFSSITSRVVGRNQDEVSWYSSALAEAIVEEIDVEDETYVDTNIDDLPPYLRGLIENPMPNVDAMLVEPTAKNINRKLNYCIMLYLKGQQMKAYRLHKGIITYNNEDAPVPTQDDLEEWEYFVADMDGQLGNNADEA